MTGKKATSTKRKPKDKPAEEELIALTLKINSETYMRLNLLRGRERSTAQEILTEALKRYLDRKGV